jgi:hypothetical protein
MVVEKGLRCISGAEQEACDDRNIAPGLATELC